MSVLRGKDGIIWLYSPVPGSPPVAAAWVTDWSLSLTVSPPDPVTPATALAASALRRRLYGPWLAVRSLTEEELLA